MHRTSRWVARWAWLPLIALSGCSGESGVDSTAEAAPLGGLDLSRLVIPERSAFYLHIRDIPGEAMAKGHEMWIELVSFQFGFEHTGNLTSGGGGGARRVVADALSIEKGIDQASPKLLEAVASGQHLPAVQLDVTDLAGERSDVVYSIVLEEVFISSFQQSASPDTAPLQTESISFNYERIRVEYRERKPDGSLGPPVTAGWDLKKNRPV